MACVIAAPSSGSGKTILSLLLTAWARQRNLSLQTFKVGPDYLDSQLLTAASGRDCRNLDLLLSSPSWVKSSFHGFGGSTELSLIEGVMGLFDGRGSSTEGSTADIALLLKLPVVLVIDASGQAGSLAALVKGFKEHEPKLNFAGVVLNRINTPRHKHLLTKVLNEIGIKVLGSLPREDPNLVLKSKYLGLEPAHEIKCLSERLERWASLAESLLDLKAFRFLLKSPKAKLDPITSLVQKNNKLNITKVLPVAVAEDKAFHFLYPETKEVLNAFGMPVLKWRPTENEPIPEEAKGVIIPGGFPEKYASQISKCLESLASLKKFYRKRPIYAECGGMLLLGKTLTDIAGGIHPMAGILPFEGKKGRLKIGYREIQGAKESMLINNGERLFGHEFHHWEISYPSYLVSKAKIKLSRLNDQIIIPPWRVNGWEEVKVFEGWCTKMTHASWVHLHWASSFNICNRWRLALEEGESNSQE